MTPIKASTRDPRVRDYVNPVRIVWTSSDNESFVENSESLLEGRDGQATLHSNNACIMRNNGKPASILLDYGKELHGGVQIASWFLAGKNRTAKIRVRFGESVMEAMSEIGGEYGATNDHAIRDQIIEIGWLGATEIGNTGFRFVRIDVVEENTFIELKSVRAVYLYRDLEYKGSFNSSDPLLNEIWKTGAYTVHLNMQDYLWDGIKRDRLVWIGDLHPETSTLQAVFGHSDIVPKSLDFIRDQTPLPGWMNTIPSYSIWWIIIHHDWYMHNGDLVYLREQKDYLIGLLDLITEHINDDGTNSTPSPFLDWPSSENQAGVQAGLHGLFTLAMKYGAVLCELLGAQSEAEKYRTTEAKLRQHHPHHADSKQAAALLALAGIMDPTEANREVIAVGGSKGVSTFYGYYMLEARAKAGDIQGSLDCIREFWGAMLSLGATTFWEDFDMEWMKDAARIDEITPEGKIDIHNTYGNYCYKGFRHSLCHGWASGPTAWMTRYVLGIHIVEAGCKTIRIEPHLGNLDWVEGTFPTPQGIVYVKHVKGADGKIQTEYKAPSGVAVISV
ncbi:alpha-L-rhamnosidase [Paenibacillus psychroresistens]|uniref:Alpha-L-rhamnosidase n=1 Tax=Paenibacillus psychroresistens TaxID=1778678 RepID=A0A6B8RRV8_9BACL|nr:family 78 glycoside hydrolase catalytic domain [Paenibacillus psychroresistens]QGQ98689.1 alpha-L-rhamnosidase [Paenibacillus psychroresistens]